MVKSEAKKAAVPEKPRPVPRLLLITALAIGAWCIAIGLVWAVWQMMG